MSVPRGAPSYLTNPTWEQFRDRMRTPFARANGYSGPFGTGEWVTYQQNNPLVGQMWSGYQDHLRDMWNRKFNPYQGDALTPPNRQAGALASSVPMQGVLSSRQMDNAGMTGMPAAGTPYMPPQRPTQGGVLSAPTPSRSSAADSMMLANLARQRAGMGPSAAYQGLQALQAQARDLPPVMTNIFGNPVNSGGLGY